MKDNTIKAILKIKEKDRIVTDVTINGVSTEGMMNASHSMVICMDGIRTYKNEVETREFSQNIDVFAKVLVSAELLRNALTLCDDYVQITLSALEDGIVMLDCNSKKMDDCKIIIAPRFKTE